MGRIFSTFVKRPLQNFNVDNRARKFLELEEVRPAPRHNKESFNVKVTNEETKEMQKPLLERLKLVKVVSEDSSPEKPQKVESNMQLPQDRSYTEPSEFGFMETKSIPDGKASLQMVLEFLNRHQSEPKIWTAQLISKEYKLDEALTEQILKHFSLYNVVLPNQEQEKGKFFSAEGWKKLISPGKGDKATETSQQ